MPGLFNEKRASDFEKVYIQYGVYFNQINFFLLIEKSSEKELSVFPNYNSESSCCEATRLRSRQFQAAYVTAWVPCAIRSLIREWLCKGTHFKVNLQVSSTNPVQRFLASHHYLNLFKFLHTVIINICHKFSRHKHSIYKQYETTFHAKLGLIKISR